MQVRCRDRKGIVDAIPEEFQGVVMPADPEVEEESIEEMLGAPMEVLEAAGFRSVGGMRAHGRRAGLNEEGIQ